MRPLASSEEIRALDRTAIERLGIPGTTLMENAGRGAARFLLEAFPAEAARGVLVLAGKGNNGGDGYVLARTVAAAGIRVRVVSVAPLESVRGAARANLEAFRKGGGEVVAAEGKGALDRAARGFVPWGVAVDALLGTGLSSAPTGACREAIRWLNRSERPVVSLDLPSGVDASTGEVPGEAVRARATVTFGLSKPGIEATPGWAYAGRVEVADLGLPPFLLSPDRFRAWLLEASDAGGVFGGRPAVGHKGTFGHVLVLGGSAGKIGAAVLAAFAALRTGAGLATIALAAPLARSIRTLPPWSAAPRRTRRTSLPEVMAFPLAERGGASRRCDEVLRALEGKDALVVGPGLGAGAETEGLLRLLLPEVRVPIVVDADALNVLARWKEWPRWSAPSIVLTPHPGEMARLMRRSAAEVQASRIEAARGLARSRGVVVLLKGARTLVADPEGRLLFNPSGTPAMATAGSGDVLSGVLGAALARRGIPPPGRGGAGWIRAGAAAFVHGRAGERSALLFGEGGVVAGDLIDQIPAALRELPPGPPRAAPAE